MTFVTKPRDSYEFTLKEHESLPVAERPTFLLRDLRERDRVRVMDSQRIGADATIGGGGTKVYLACQATLVGWRNIRYSEDEAAAFESMDGSKAPTDETLALLPWTWKVEIARHVLNVGLADEEDVEK